MNKSLKVAIVTGASSGVGLEISKRLSRGNIEVFMISHSTNKLEKAQLAVEKVSKTEVTSLVVDVRKKSEVFATVDKIIKQKGRIDYLINCAGISIHGDFDKLGEWDWDKVIDTNLKGIFLFCRAVWLIMKQTKNCQIITISSASGLTGYSNGSIYCASKFGVNGLMEALALEGQEVGIKVTNICPGQINTPIWNPDDPEVNEARKNMLNTKSLADLIFYILKRPWNEHLKRIIISPFAIQPYLRGRNKGPGGKFPEVKKLAKLENGKNFRI